MERTYFWKASPKVNEFRHTHKFCDVIIRVQDKAFPCHRAVLASMSEYFDVMFGGNFKEGHTTEVVLHDVDETTFRTILDFMYTGRLPEITNDNIYNLFWASDFYGLDDLKTVCSEFVDEHLSARRISSMNIVKLFSLARSCALANDSLEDLLKEHVLIHLAAFTQTKGFLEMPYEDLSIVLRDYRQSTSSSVPYANEDFLLDALIRWIRHAYAARKRYFEELVDKLDFEKISTHCARFLANSSQDEMEAVLRVRIARMAPAVADSEAPPTPYQYLPSGDREATIHIYLSLPVNEAEPVDSLDTYNVYTLNQQKAEPDWYSSGSFFVSRKPNSKRRPLTFVASEKLDFIYTLYHDSANEYASEFLAYSGTEFRDPRKLSIGPPMRDFREPSLGVIGNRVYLYNPNRNTFDYSRSMRMWDCKDFSIDEYKRDLYSYSCDIDKWYPVPEMRLKVAFADLATDSSNNLLYLIGGMHVNFQIPRGYVQAYDDRAPTWFEVSKSAHHHSELSSCCSAAGKIYVTDGRAVEVYDPLAGRWETITCPFKEENWKLWSPMWTVSYENKVYFFHKKRSSFWILDPFLKEWSEPISLEVALDLDPDLNECCFLHNIQNVIVFKPIQRWEDLE